MAGGEMNLLHTGPANIIIHGTPTNTLWYGKYAKCTNFGIQKFRLDFDGLKKLKPSSTSKYTFKYSRYGDLIIDSYLVLNLPDIWSPFMPVERNVDSDGKNYPYYIPYEFRWIDNIGLNMINEVEFTVGGATLQKFSGEYLKSIIQRDYTVDKKEMINKMTANLPYYNNPEQDINNPSRKYPNAVYNNSSEGAEPSIRGKQIIIPISAWFGLCTKHAFPLISMQNNILEMHVTIKPIRELFIIRDVLNPNNNYEFKSPNFNELSDQFYRFIQTPPGSPGSSGQQQPTTMKEFYDSYVDKQTEWNTDMHVVASYGFLDKDEQYEFAKSTRTYLIKEIYETDYTNIVNTNTIKVDTTGMVTSWMWFARRSDYKDRNEWSNYSNWAFNTKPYYVSVPSDASSSNTITPYINLYNVLPASPHSTSIYPGFYPPTVSNIYTDIPSYTISMSASDMIRPIWNEQGQESTDAMFPYYWGNTQGPSPFSTTGLYMSSNAKNIITQAGIMLNGEYREDISSIGTYNYIEKYSRSKGGGTDEYDGLYCYNFCMDTSPSTTQPSGAINLSSYPEISIKLTTITPPLASTSQSSQVCDIAPGGTTTEQIGTTKKSWGIYKYTYDIHLMEERYNVISFIGGNVNLMFAR
jgi:hypothetical protein